MIGVGVIGYGYWGPNLVRNFGEIPGCRVRAVSDLDRERLALAESRCPGVRTTTDWKELIDDVAVDAIAIATPVSTHFELALRALEAGKHVLVEKPMAATAEEAVRLVETAAGRRLVLMVDHTFVYTPAVAKIRELVTRAELGELYYYDSVRVNLGLFQHDVNVVWDLAVHDLAIMDHVLGRTPRAVSAAGVSHVPGEPENIAYLTLFFPDRLLGHLHVNWLAPVKIRRTLIGGSQKMIVYDDLEPSEKVKVYDKGISVANGPESLYKMLIAYRSGDMWAPRLEMVEALRVETLHFVECVEQGRRALTDGEVGLRVVRLLEAASESLRQGGRPVPLGSDGPS